MLTSDIIDLCPRLSFDLTFPFSHNSHVATSGYGTKHARLSKDTLMVRACVSSLN